LSWILVLAPFVMFFMGLFAVIFLQGMNLLW
jgi:hypothetical protein